MTRLRPLVHYRSVMCLVVAALALTGCTGGAEPPARVVRFWAMGREGEAVQGLIPEFERRHPGVRVRVQQIPWSAAHEKLLTAFVGGAMPDVFQLGTTWVPELAAIGALAALDTRLATAPSIPADDFFSGSRDANRIGDTTYGVPWYVDTRLLFYRSDLLARAGFDAPPADWRTWAAALTRIKEQAGPDRYAILLPLREWQPLVILALQRRAELLRDDGRYGNFRSPEFRAAFSFYLNFYQRGLAPSAPEGQIANLFQDFGAGFFAFYISGPWNLGELAARLPPELQDDWATAPMPAPGLVAGLSIAGGASLALSRGAREPEAAWELIEYLAEPATQIELYRRTGDLPARRSAWQDPALADNHHAQAFWTQLQHMQAPPKVPEWERIAAKITDYTEAAVRGDLDPDAALTGLDRDVDALLEKRRWLLDRNAHHQEHQRHQVEEIGTPAGAFNPTASRYDSRRGLAAFPQTATPWCPWCSWW